MRKIKSFDIFTDGNVVNVNLQFNSTNLEDIDNAIKGLQEARKEAAKEWFTCEWNGCNEKFTRGSGRWPKQFCSVRHQKKAYRRKTRQAEALA